MGGTLTFFLRICYDNINHSSRKQQQQQP